MQIFYCCMGGNLNAYNVLKQHGIVKPDEYSNNQIQQGFIDLPLEKRMDNHANKKTAVRVSSRKSAVGLEGRIFCSVENPAPASGTAASSQLGGRAARRLILCLVNETPGK